ncbi:MAG: helix-turn-helix domain-containing protein [Terriglobales bacterium]
MTTLASARPRTAPERLVAILPLLEFFRQSRAGCTVTIVLSDGSKPRTSKDVVADIAAQHRISPSTICKWYSRFQRGCYAALANRRRCDAYFTERPDAAELLARLLSKKYSAQEIYETLRRAVPAPAPCYVTVAGYCRRLKAQARAARRRGKQHGAVA